MKKDYKDMQEHWEEFYAKAEEKLRENRLGIYSVCYPNQSRRRNIFTDWLQNRTFQKLLNKCGHLEGKVALDIGTGAGRWAVRLLKKGLKVTAIDSNKEMIERNTKLFPQINSKEMLVTHLDFEDSYFDLVTSVTVLHHIPYEMQKEVIKEIARVTKNGRHILILESINTNSILPTMFANAPARWTELFEENGCKKLASVGHEYIPLISAANRLSHLYRHSIKHEKSTSAREHHTASPRLFRVAETGIILMSYPVEIFCQQIVPNRFAQQAGILFQKIANSHDVK
jgi:ubiquinone/menaquinone biosynthesis C-methylase UbiE